MNIEEVYQYYGSAYKAAAAINVTRAAFYAWQRMGCIPYIRQKQYEKVTKGELKASSSLDRTSSSIKKYHLFRFYEDKIGMCEVFSIVFRAIGSPRITCFFPNDRKKTFCSFDISRLMLKLPLEDSEGVPLYEGDIVEIDKKRFSVEKNDYIFFSRLQLETFLIVGNKFQ